MVLARLDLKGRDEVDAFFVLHHERGVDISLDAVGVRVELLLRGDELAEPQPVLVLVRQEHLVEPCSDVLDRLVRVFFNLCFGLVQ